MQKIYMTILLILTSFPLHADQIFLYDNTSVTGVITEFTSEFIKYRKDTGENAEIARSEVEKIIYTGGRELDLTDKIYLKDNTVLSGKVTGISGEYLEYNPAGAPPYDRILKSSVSKIVYSNGRVENFTAETGTDRIYLKDGRLIEGRNIAIYDRYIEFYNNSGVKESYGTNIIDKIVYSTGEVKKFIPGDTGNKRGQKTGEKTGEASAYSFAEFELGWNGYTGLGARLDYFLTDSFSINGGLGLCFWGYRVSAALRYYPDTPYGLAFSLGAAYNTGGETETELDTTDVSGNATSETVTFDMKPVVTVNASILYSWMVNEKDKIYIEAGYSYAIQKEKYTYETESGRELTKQSEDFMDIIAPGGVILTFGYAFRL